MTICSLAAGVVTAPAATAAPAFGTTIDKVDGVNTCVFTADSDDTVAGSMLSARKHYNELRSILRRDIRKTLPDLADSFSRADAITGTAASPKAGSVDSDELKEIIAAVSSAMVERGYHEDEVYLAFHHSPAGETVRQTIKPADLDLLPPLTLTEARVFGTQLPSDPNSIPSRVKRYFRAAAQLRDWARTLRDNSSIALMSSVNTDATNKLLSSTKDITKYLPSELEAIARATVSRCTTTLTHKNVLDGSTSSQLVKNPIQGGSSDPARKKQREAQGDFFTGSAELSSGKNTSSVDQYKELSSGDSSNDKARSRKVGVLLATVGLVSFILNMLVKASPLAAIGARMFSDMLARAQAAANEGQEQQDQPANQ